MRVNRMDRTIEGDGMLQDMTIAESLACVAVLGDMPPGETYTVVIDKPNETHAGTVHVNRHAEDGTVIDTRAFWIPDVLDRVRRLGSR